jgi:hypothetical protein
MNGAPYLIGNMEPGTELAKRAEAFPTESWMKRIIS